MSDKATDVSFLMAECLRLAGEAMKSSKPSVTIDFKDRRIIRATNKACMIESVQNETFQFLKTINSHWTIILDKDNQVLYISFK